MPSSDLPLLVLTFLERGEFCLPKDPGPSGEEDHRTVSLAPAPPVEDQFWQAVHSQ